MTAYLIISVILWHHISVLCNPRVHSFSPCAHNRLHSIRASAHPPPQGIAAVKAIRSMRRWAYETFGADNVLQFVVMATPDDLQANAEFIRMAHQVWWRRFDASIYPLLFGLTYFSYLPVKSTIPALDSRFIHDA
jgi:hypothetical protein